MDYIYSKFQRYQSPW